MLGIDRSVVDRMIDAPVTQDLVCRSAIPRRQRAGDVARPDAIARSSSSHRRALGELDLLGVDCRRRATSRSRSANCCRAPRSSS
jgi:hypothetical protein